MTPIQAAALPPALVGHDLIARASTGSGKTAVFALALLATQNPRFFGVQALVVCPTRELADQVAGEVRRLGRSIENLKVVTVCGGVPLRGQAATLTHGAHVVVGTPGRIQDHLRRGSLVLNGLRTLVFDEADRMLEMGFYDDMEAILTRCPANRQTLLFSATYPPRIEKLAEPFLRDPVVVSVTGSESPPSIVQQFFEVTRENRLEMLFRVLSHFHPERALIFVNTKVVGREVLEFLKGKGVSVLELSGDLEQKERDEAMILFSGLCLSVIVATDVASRGLDIASLDLVVNFEPSPDPEIHVHRIGRTGRAGEQGLAVSLVLPNEKALTRRLEDFQNQGPLVWGNLDDLTAQESGWVPPRVMFKLSDTRREKLRPGDILGALTAGAGLAREQIGTIKVTDYGTWIAVDRAIVEQVEKALAVTPIKGKVRRFQRWC